MFWAARQMCANARASSAFSSLLAHVRRHGDAAVQRVGVIVDALCRARQEREAVGAHSDDEVLSVFHLRVLLLYDAQHAHHGQQGGHECQYDVCLGGACHL